MKKKYLIALGIITIVTLLVIVAGIIILASRKEQNINIPDTTSNTIPDEETPADEEEPEDETPQQPQTQEVDPSIILPDFEITTVVGGLDHPWDVDFLPDQTMLFTQRGGSLSVFRNGSTIHTFDFEDAYSRGEGGVLGLAVDPEYSRNNYVYVCLNSSRGANPEIRVVRLKLNSALNNIDERTDIVTGMPSADGGRHSGCQVEFGNDGYLWVGTGDRAVGSEPQDPVSLGGKILRVNRDGRAIEGNLGSPYDSRIFSYGHRNVQGLLFFPTNLGFSFEGFSIEQGPDMNDEINILRPGNFGWNPIPGYNESVPMTDKSLYPNAFDAMFESGSRTFALSGGTVLVGNVWGNLQGTIVAGALKDEKLTFVKVNRDGSYLSTINAFEGQFGRIRTAQIGPDQALYLLTDNGGNDSIIRMMPK